MRPDSPAEPPVVLLGSARLPKSIAGDQPGALLIELALDAQDGRIVGVAATVTLPGYNALLRSLLVGRRLDEVDGTAQKLSAHLRGPLLRPTIAALANAVSNHGDSQTAGAAGGVP